MVVLKKNAEEFNNTPPRYTSELSSESSLANPGFRGLIEGLGAGGAAKGQVASWNLAQKVLLKESWTSKAGGGVPQFVLDKGTWLAEKSGSEVVEGIFADVAWPTSTSVKSFGAAAANTGLAIAQRALGAVPVYGKILKAGVSVGRFLFKMANKPDEADLIVPWQGFVRDTDEDVVNAFLSAKMDGADWTDIWMPTLEWEKGFSLETTDRGGNTRSFGVFNSKGVAQHGSGAGMMPGTQRIADAIQIAEVHNTAGGRRQDLTTSVGSFFPTTSQFATGLWTMVQRWGSPDMYKVRAGELEIEWDEYFGQLFVDGFSAYDKLKGSDRVYISKCLAQFVVAKTRNGTQLGLDVDAQDGPFVDPRIFTSKFPRPVATTVYVPPNEIFTGPTCHNVKKRQLAALSGTIVCALIRPEEVDGQPPFAAFSDRSPAIDAPGTFGEQLTKKCLEMRELLLTHPQRYLLAQRLPGNLAKQQAPDVQAVDPAYAVLLEESFTSDAGSLAPGGGRGPRRGRFDQSPDGGAVPVGGGAPFSTLEDESWWSKHWGSALAVAAGGAYLYSRKR